SLTSSHSCRVKELVSIHGLLTFFFFLCFLPAECSQNGLKPGVAAQIRKGWFSCRCCGIMRHSPLQTECHFTMPISAIARCNLHLPDYNPIEYLWKKTKQRATHNKYFKEFAELTVSVDKALAYFATHPETVLGLFGCYCEESGLPLKQAA